MSKPQIDEMVRLLAESWAQRSPDEQSGFVNRLTAPGSAAPPAESLRRVHERGALSGAVAPRDLVRGMSREEADRLLDAALVDFDRTLVAGNWAWTLRNGPRQEVLARLSASRTLPQALDDVAEIATDAAGEVLRELARTGEQRSAAQKVAPEKRTRVVLQALSWAEPLGGHAGDLAEARRQAGLAAVRDSYETLLRQGFYGRVKELARLREFAEAPVHSGRPVPFLAVTGIGGSGKSTLLAQFVRPYLDRLATADPTAPAIVVIDFDRVHFRANAEIELSFELTRQLGCAAPVASADFSVLRHQTRQERRSIGVDVAQGSHNVEGNIRSSSGFDFEAGVLVQLHGLEHRPVVLVLDTFEEWQRDRPFAYAGRDTWNDPEQRIMEWIWRLRHEMRLQGLRVIASGRADVARTEGVHAVRPLRLGDLGRAAATRMLDALGVGGQPGVALLRAVGGNPLTLRVAARFYTKLSAAERQRFTADVRKERANLDQDLRRAVLYDRFLDHIRDNRVRSLAHPGLALRRVTPDLVRHVLAVHCGLGRISADTATELTGKLADEVWLVRSTPDGLRHQPDVRRAMLKMMSDDPEHAEAVRNIHRAAADWYGNGRDPELSGEIAQTEWFYHALMLESGDRSILTLGDELLIARLAVALGTGVADLHPLVQNQVRALRGDDLRDAEALGLPTDIWNAWFAHQGSRLVVTGNQQRALNLFRRRMRLDRDLDEPVWLAQAYCDTASWSGFWKALRVSEPIGPASPSNVFRSGRYEFLNALCSSDPRQLELYDQHLTGFLDGHLHGRFGAIAPGLAYERVFLGLLGGHASVMTTPMALELQGEHRIKINLGGADLDLYPVDQLRRAVVWAAEPSPYSRFSLNRTAGLFRPDFEWVAAWARTFGPHTGDGSFLTQFSDLAQGRSDVILGDLSSRFGRIWPIVELRRESEVNSADLIRVLRGDNPELRPAIRLAVTAIAKRHGLRGLGEIAYDLLPIPASDLHPDALQHAGPTQSRKLGVQFVEYVDRSGVMRPFLAAARAAYPDIELVRRVEEAFAIWDDTYDRLLRTVLAREGPQ